MVSQFDIVFKVVGVFEKLGIPYVIGGSFASSVHGLFRLTNDVDILAAVRVEHVPALIAELGDDFYADELAITRAVKAHRSFNVIYIDLGFKADVFVAMAGGFHAKQLERAQPATIGSDPQGLVRVASPEDVILAKLDWYRRGNEVSNQQWRDVQCVIRVQAQRLDMEYLSQWAHELGVLDLLERALGEAGFLEAAGTSPSS